ncbi:hypothetical protein KIPB_004966, partial [Kipferlia bialata]
KLIPGSPLRLIGARAKPPRSGPSLSYSVCEMKGYGNTLCSSEYDGMALPTVEEGEGKRERERERERSKSKKRKGHSRSSSRTGHRDRDRDREREREPEEESTKSQDPLTSRPGRMVYPQSTHSHSSHHKRHGRSHSHAPPPSPPIFTPGLGLVPPFVGVSPQGRVCGVGAVVGQGMAGVEWQGVGSALLPLDTDTLSPTYTASVSSIRVAYPEETSMQSVRDTLIANARAAIGQPRARLNCTINDMWVRVGVHNGLGWVGTPVAVPMRREKDRDRERGRGRDREKEGLCLVPDTKEIDRLRDAAGVDIADDLAVLMGVPCAPGVCILADVCVSAGVVGPSDVVLSEDVPVSLGWCALPVTAQQPQQHQIPRDTHSDDEGSDSYRDSDRDRDRDRPPSGPAATPYPLDSFCCRLTTSGVPAPFGLRPLTVPLDQEAEEDMDRTSRSRPGSRADHGRPSSRTRGRRDRDRDSEEGADSDREGEESSDTPPSALPSSVEYAVPRLTVSVAYARTEAAEAVPLPDPEGSASLADSGHSERSSDDGKGEDRDRDRERDRDGKRERDRDRDRDRERERSSSKGRSRSRRHSRRGSTIPEEDDGERERDRERERQKEREREETLERERDLEEKREREREREREDSKRHRHRHRHRDSEPPSPDSKETTPDGVEPPSHLSAPSSPPVSDSGLGYSPVTVMAQFDVQGGEGEGESKEKETPFEPSAELAPQQKGGRAPHEASSPLPPSVPHRQSGLPTPAPLDHLVSVPLAHRHIPTPGDQRPPMPHSLSSAPTPSQGQGEGERENWLALRVDTDTLISPHLRCRLVVTGDGAEGVSFSKVILSVEEGPGESMLLPFPPSLLHTVHDATLYIEDTTLGMPCTLCRGTVQSLASPAATIVCHSVYASADAYLTASSTLQTVDSRRSVSVSLELVALPLTGPSPLPPPINGGHLLATPPTPTLDALSAYLGLVREGREAMQTQGERSYTDTVAAYRQCVLGLRPDLVVGVRDGETVTIPHHFGSYPATLVVPSPVLGLLTHMGVKVTPSPVLATSSAPSPYIDCQASITLAEPETQLTLKYDTTVGVTPQLGSEGSGSVLIPFGKGLCVEVVTQPHSLYFRCPSTATCSLLRYGGGGGSRESWVQTSPSSNGLSNPLGDGSAGVQMPQVFATSCVPAQVSVTMLRDMATAGVGAGAGGMGTNTKGQDMLGTTLGKAKGTALELSVSMPRQVLNSLDTSTKGWASIEGIQYYVTPGTLTDIVLIPTPVDIRDSVTNALLSSVVVVFVHCPSLSLSLAAGETLSLGTLSPPTPLPPTLPLSRFNLSPPIPGSITDPSLLCPVRPGTYASMLRHIREEDGRVYVAAYNVVLAVSAPRSVSHRYPVSLKAGVASKKKLPKFSFSTEPLSVDVSHPELLSVSFAPEPSGDGSGWVAKITLNFKAQTLLNLKTSCYLFVRGPNYQVLDSYCLALTYKAA